MLPIGDDDTSRRTVPLVTYALIALNVLFSLVELSGVAYMAHVGRFIAGFVLTFLFRGNRGTQATG